MKFRFNKKLLPVALCMALMLTVFMVPAQAASPTAQAKGTSISPNTVITKDNMNEVLKYLGIDSSNFIQTDESKNSKIETVKDLENAIQQCKKQPSVINSTYSETNVSSVSANSNSAMATANAVGTVMMYLTTNCDGYTLTYSVAGQYSGAKWTGCGGAWVSIDSLDVIFVRKVDSVSFNITLTDNNNNLCMKAAVNVGLYIGLKYGIVKVSSQTVNTTANFGAGWYIPK